MGSLSFNYIVSFIVLLLWAVVVSAGKTFNVKDYGAKTDGRTDCTSAILSAWKEACEFPGDATVYLPPGKYMSAMIMMSGPCQGDMTFRLDGAMRGTKDLSKFPRNNWVAFQFLSNFKLTGNGVFDGMGRSTWAQNKRVGKVFPTSIQFTSLNDSLVEGIRSKNAKMFHMMVYRCSKLKIDKVTIQAPANSPNTDGIHVSLSNDTQITNTNIRTGDDCISIGQTNRGLYISDVRCGPGHGISVGSLGKFEDDKDVTDLYLKNCELSRTTNGLRIKTWQKSYQMTCSNFTYENIIMKKVFNPIIIDQEYCPNGVGKCGGKSTSSQVKIVDVTFKNIKGTSESPTAINLLCSQSNPCKGLVFRNIDFKHTGSAIANSTCLNVANPKISNVQPPLCQN